MQLTFTPLRVAALVALMVGYALMGGFAVPVDVPDRTLQGWVATLLLFVTGAVFATVVDQRIGREERSNIRWFHVVAGIGAMAVAVTIRYRLSAS